jgi:ATP-dependent DNA helicase PIF1
VTVAQPGPGGPPKPAARPSLTSTIVDEEAFRTATNAINRGAPIVMILGGAGTGKTTFLRELQKDRAKQQVFLAPTGVAALNLGGQTLHSFFGIPPRIVNSDEIQVRARQRKLFRKIERIVIDEISMVRADLLDTVDRILRLARECDVAFGGVQAVLVGDLLQLPPVVPLAEEEMLERLGYRGPYCFDARVLKQNQVAHVLFSTVYRQTERAFIDCLHRVRRGDRVDGALSILNDSCVRPHRPGTIPVLLAPTNTRADDYNAKGISALTSAAQMYIGQAIGEFELDRDRLPVPESLVLKVGARVMAVRNDRGKRWVNGSVGTAMALFPDRVTVRLDSGLNVEIERFTWEKIRYAWDDVKQRVAANVVGTYTQLPIVHAWALTIHKAQGLTLEDVRVDFAYGAFAPGQAYVAISRSRSLDGLSLVRPVRSSEVTVAPSVIAYMKEFELRAS